MSDKVGSVPLFYSTQENGKKMCGRSNGEMEKQGFIGQVQKDATTKIAIALSANKDHGKTSILKALANIFRAGNGVSLVDVRPMGTGVDEMWCFEKNGVRIGIATGGDDDNAVNVAFDFFEKNTCRIVFCATRYYSNSPSWNQFVTRCDNGGYDRDWQGVDEHSPEVLEIMDKDVAENVLFKML